MNLPQRETMGLLMASRVRRIDTRKRWHFWPVGSERVCNRTTEPRIRQPARRGNARHATLQFAWISLALSLTNAAVSEEMTGVWFEIEHVCARPRGRD
jgi:hypothetical protein